MAGEQALYVSGWAGRNVLAILNLIAFLGSIFVLWKTKKAAERQSERTSKPVISLSRENWELSDAELLQPEFHATVLDPFRLRNVGNGTALVVHWRFKTPDGKEMVHGMIPHVQINRTLRTDLTAAQIGLSKTGGIRIFECDYLSISGDQYRTLARIEGLKIVDFAVKKI